MHHERRLFDYITVDVILLRDYNILHNPNKNGHRTRKFNSKKCLIIQITVDMHAWGNKTAKTDKCFLWEISSPRPTKMTGVLTLRRRESSPELLEFPESGKKLPVLKATNCSLQSAGASGGNRVAGRVTEARATEFWRKREKQKDMSCHKVCI